MCYVLSYTTNGFIQKYGYSFSLIHKKKVSRTTVYLMREREKFCACSERLKINMDKENVFEDEDKSEDEEEIMSALPDSDNDELDNQLINMNTKDEGEEYR